MLSTSLVTPVLVWVTNGDLGWVAQARAYARQHYPSRKCGLRNALMHRPAEMERCEVVVVKNLDEPHYLAVAEDYRKAGAVVDVFGQGRVRPTDLVVPEIPAVPEIRTAELSQTDDRVKPPMETMSERLAELARKTQPAKVDWMVRTKLELQTECEARGLKVKGTGIKGSITKADYLRALGVEQ